MKLFRLAAVAMTAALICSCSDNKGNEPTGNGSRAELDLTPAQAADLNGLKDFSFDLFAKGCEAGDANENLTVSPFGLASILAMQANGLEQGEALDQILTTLNCGKDIAAVNDLFATVTDQLRNLDRSSHFDFASGVWADNSYSLKSEFAKSLTSNYNATIKEYANMPSDQKAITDMNLWGAEATAGHVTNFGDLNSTCYFVIANAFNFKGGWQEPFNRDETAKATFTNANGSTVTVDMMSNLFEHAGYTKGENYRAVTLSYGNDSFRFTVALPDDDADLNTVIASLRELIEYTGASELNDNVNVAMPRFSLMDSRQSLVKLLESCGISAAFNQSGIYSKLTDKEEFSINDCLQINAIEVNEEGTTASALTYEMLYGYGGSEAIPSITLDRPFLFILWERSTSTVLMAGRVASL